MSKKELRESILARRKTIKENDKKDWDKKIRENLLNLDQFKRAKNIFIYVNMSDEVNTVELIELILAEGKTVAVPKVIPVLKAMEALEIKSFADLSESGAFGILEPTMDSKNISKEIDIAIVPGLAFDEEKNRLGYGGGFYDKFFSKYKNIEKIALCYEYQIVKSTPRDEFDIKMDAIITEKRVI